MRNYAFTPAAERAIEFAAGWSVDASGEPLRPAALLMGLLAEPECRAALLLAEQGIGPAEVHARWPELKLSDPQSGRKRRFSSDVTEALFTANQRLEGYPQPLELATEHLLLGLAASENEVGTWLAERGLDWAALEAEIHRLAGHQPGPLAWDEEPVDLPEEPLAPERVAALRILDAAANRAGEGLRVIEDYVRFALDDRLLSAECKSVRHALTETLSQLSPGERQAARETRADVGTSLTLDSERQRAGLAQVVAASFARVEQALRSLEEYAKTVAPNWATSLEALRYRVYTLERIVGVAGFSRQRLATARLYVLIDGGESAAQLSQTAQRLAAAGVNVLQLRDKRLPDRELLGRARALRAATRGTQTLFIMNDRPDLALLADADGVHVGQEELSVKDARRIVGPDRLVGVSTHSIEQARAAVWDGANYLGVGPTFPSPTKQFDAYPGLNLLRQFSGEISLPAFAIGGITAERLPEVLACGFRRVALASAVTGATDPAQAVRDLLTALGPAG